MSPSTRLLLLMAVSSPALAQTTDFADVLPIFESSCTLCHGPDLQESQLRLDSEAAASVVIEDLGGESRPATFAALAPAADPITGLFDLEYHIDNPEHRIRGGMVATITLPLRQQVERVLVPRAALTRRAGKLAVFVLAPAPAELEASPSEGYELRVALHGLGEDGLTADDMAVARDRFDDRHAQIHGHAAKDRPVEIVSYRVRLRVTVPKFEPVPAGEIVEAPAPEDAMFQTFPRCGESDTHRYHQK